MNNQKTHQILEGIIETKQDFLNHLISLLSNKNIGKPIYIKNYHCNEYGIADYIALTPYGDLIILELKSPLPCELDKGISQLRRYKEHFYTLDCNQILNSFKTINAEAYDSLLNQIGTDIECSHNILKQHLNQNLGDYKILALLILPEATNELLRQFDTISVGDSNTYLITLNENSKLDNLTVLYGNKNINISQIKDNNFEYMSNYLNHNFLPPILDSIEYLTKLTNKLTLEIASLKSTISQYTSETTPHTENTKANYDYDISSLDLTATVFGKNITLKELATLIAECYLKEKSLNESLTIREFSKLLDTRKFGYDIPTLYILRKLFNCSLGRILIIGGVCERSIYDTCSWYSNSDESHCDIKKKRHASKENEIILRAREIYDTCGPLTNGVIKSNGLSPSTVRYYFGTLSELCHRAGIVSKVSKRLDLSRSDVIMIYLDVCDRFGYDVSAKVLADEGVPFHFVSKYFGGIDGLRMVVNNPGGIGCPNHLE